MSTDYGLICEETKLYIWIGQGFGGCECLYSGDEATMDLLNKFLNVHIGRPLKFIASDFYEGERVDFTKDHYKAMRRPDPFEDLLKGEA